MQQSGTVRGLVIRETDFADTDRYITVLNEEGQRIEVFCAGVRGRNSKVSAAIRLFCYTELTLFISHNGRLKLKDAALVTSFWEVTQDIESYALCCYFAELAMIFSDTVETCPQISTLLLHALSTLCHHKRQQEVVKAAFELRLLAECGFMPQLGQCGVCQKPLPQAAFFSIPQGGICCPACVQQIGGDWIALQAGTLEAMRYILQCDLKKIFAFSLGVDSLQQLAQTCQNNMLFYLQKELDSLKFYQSLKIPIKNTGAKHE